MKSVNALQKINPKSVRIGSIDKSNMRQVIRDFPKQFRAGIFAAENIHLPPMQLRSPIVVCGMGGSALVGDLLKLWFRHEYMGVSEFEIIIHRSYGLPKLERKHFEDGVWEPLIIASSYSGNTEEALSAYEDAKKKSLPVIAMSAGGKLRERALADGKPFVQIPETHIQPRSSVGYQFGALASLLANLSVMTSRNRDIAQLEAVLKPQMLEQKGRALAKKLLGTIPIVYASDAWRELAHIIKIKFNEHAKMSAFWNYFPELNHNEMNGFASLINPKSKAQNPKQQLSGHDFHILALMDENDHPRVKRRMEIMAKILAKKGIKSTCIPIEGKTPLEKIFSTLILGDWIAYYTAVLRGVDPTPVDMVEEFKKLMK